MLDFDAYEVQPRRKPTNADCSPAQIQFKAVDWNAPSTRKSSDETSPFKTVDRDRSVPNQIPGSNVSVRSLQQSPSTGSSLNRKRSHDTASLVSPTSKRTRTNRSCPLGTWYRPLVIDEEVSHLFNGGEENQGSMNDAISNGSDDVGTHIIEVADEFMDLECWDELQPAEQRLEFTSLSINSSKACSLLVDENAIGTEISSYQFGFMTLSVGKSVELRDGDFLRIQKLFEDDGHHISVEGQRFRRAWQLEGIIEKKPNEVCQIIEKRENTSSQGLVQKRQIINVNDILCFRDLRLTNLLFPEASFRTDKILYPNLDIILEQAALTCRWKLITAPAALNERRSSTWKEQSLQRLSPSECDPGRFIEPEHLRQQFRGETVKGGSSTERSSSESASNQDNALNHQAISERLVLDLTNEYHQSIIESTEQNRQSLRIAQAQRNCLKAAAFDSDDDVVLVNRIDQLSVLEIESNVTSPQVISISDSEDDLEDLNPAAISFYCTQGSSYQRSPDQAPPTVPGDIWSAYRQTYTFGDAFCGCGGTSRGATMAKLQIEWGFDFNLRAIEAYKSNFRSVNCIHKAAHEFLEDCNDEAMRERCKVDILHISPPCQPFSPAHTVIGKDDERNEASLFAIDGLLEKIRPRVVTMEETFGLLSRHPLWFRSVLHMFTRHNYSVRWKIMNCQDFGIPQARRRLVLVGSWSVLLAMNAIFGVLLIELKSRRSIASFSSTNPWSCQNIRFDYNTSQTIHNYWRPDRVYTRGLQCSQPKAVL